MSNIHFRRFPSKDEWEMDCFVLPNDKIAGELVHYSLRKTLDFREVIVPGLFSTLCGLLERIPFGIKTTATKLVIGTLKDEKRAHHYLLSSEDYLPGTPEAEMWELVNSIFKKRLEDK